MIEPCLIDVLAANDPVILESVNPHKRRIVKCVLAASTEGIRQNIG